MSDALEVMKTRFELSEQKRTALEERLRTLETSYTIDRRVVLIVGAALAGLMLAFFGYSISTFPAKIMEKLESEVFRKTGTTLEERINSINTTIAKSERLMGDLEEMNTNITSVQENISALQQELSQAHKSQLAIAGIDIAHGSGTGQLLKYSDSGYSFPDGLRLACEPGEWITALRIYSNKEAKFAGLQIDCRQLNIKVR